MNLPNIITALLAAQSSFDPKTFADCFSENAIVIDEGKSYSGRKAIREWNEETNQKFRTRVLPLELFTDQERTVLVAEVSGNFDGSPVRLNYNFKLDHELIQYLEITG